MKKFVTGFIVGAIICSMLGAFAVSYIAEPVTFKIMVNGKEFVSESPALAINGSTYLPLKATGEALGVPVKWNSDLFQVEVGSASSTNVETKTLNSDKWKMTYLDCKSYTEIDEYTKAEDGKEFVVASFELENISAESQTFSIAFLESYFDDYRTPITVLGQQIDGAYAIGATSIEPGKKIKGYLSYEVELGWEKLDIVYNDSLLDDSNAIKFTINK